MLVRALKMLGYFSSETTSMDIDTAALDQPGDEGCAYGRAKVDWQRRTAARQKDLTGRFMPTN
jgi:hypothetical protein